MFGLAYVFLPFTDAPPSEAIAASLSRFGRGRRGDVPDEWLRFHDETAHIRKMHEARYTFRRDNGLRISGGESWYLNSGAVVAEMERRGKDEWTVCFTQIEPDLGRFVERFLRPLERHPVTGGFGRWLNGLREWDWWGGRRLLRRSDYRRTTPGRPQSRRDLVRTMLLASRVRDAWRGSGGGFRAGAGAGSRRSKRQQHRARRHSPRYLPNDRRTADFQQRRASTGLGPG